MMVCVTSHCVGFSLQALALVGEFNGWSPKDHHWAQKNEFGTWSLFLPDGPDGESAIPHRCLPLKSMSLNGGVNFVKG